MKLEDINKQYNKFKIQQISMNSATPQYISDVSFNAWAKGNPPKKKKYINFLRKAGVEGI